MLKATWQLMLLALPSIGDNMSDKSQAKYHVGSQKVPVGKIKHGLLISIEPYMVATWVKRQQRFSYREYGNGRLERR